MSDEWEQFFGVEEDETAPGGEAVEKEAQDAKTSEPLANEASAPAPGGEVVISDAEDEGDGEEEANAAGADFFAALDDLPSGTPDQLKQPLSANIPTEEPPAVRQAQAPLQPQQKAAAKAKLQPASKAPGKSPAAKAKAGGGPVGQAAKAAGGRAAPFAGKAPIQPGRVPNPKAAAPPAGGGGGGGVPQGTTAGGPQRPQVIKVIKKVDSQNPKSGSAATERQVRVIKYQDPKAGAQPKPAVQPKAAVAKPPSLQSEKVLRTLQKVRKEHMQDKFVAQAVQRGQGGQAQSPAAAAASTFRPPQRPPPPAFTQRAIQKRQISWEQTPEEPSRPDKRMRGAPWMKQPDPKPTDDSSRGQDERTIVVNIANVGCSYAHRVLGMDSNKFGFDWHGIRICVNTLVKAGYACIGVCHENYTAPDKQRGKVTIPPDIKGKFSSLVEAPRARFENHRSADDEVTIKCAFRRNCCFLDNDNYSDWSEQLHEQDVRDWLKQSWAKLHKFYFWDTGTGDFNLLHGNNLQPGQDKKDLAKPRQR